MKTTTTEKEKIMIMRRFIFLMVVAAVSAVLAGGALATPGSGVVGEVFARGNFEDQVDIKLKIKGHGRGQEVVLVDDARETVMQRIEIAPGGFTGWHSHPGPVVVLVTQGALTLSSADDPCMGETYTVGQAFIDSGQGHVHNGRNLSGTTTVVWVTYFDVPPGGSFRIDAPAPATCF